MWFYKFELNWFFSEENRVVKERGMVVGMSFANVVDKLEDFYGNLINLKVEQVGESQDVIVSDEIMEGEINVFSEE